MKKKREEYLQNCILLVSIIGAQLSFNPFHH